MNTSHKVCSWDQINWQNQGYINDTDHHTIIYEKIINLIQLTNEEFIIEKHYTSQFTLEYVNT